MEGKNWDFTTPAVIGNTNHGWHWIDLLYGGIVSFQKVECMNEQGDEWNDNDDDKLNHHSDIGNSMNEKKYEEENSNLKNGSIVGKRERERTKAFGNDRKWDEF